MLLQLCAVRRLLKAFIGLLECPEDFGLFNLLDGPVLLIDEELFSLLLLVLLPPLLHDLPNLFQLLLFLCFSLWSNFIVVEKAF